MLLFDRCKQLFSQQQKDCISNTIESSFNKDQPFFVGDIESSLNADNSWKFELIVFTDGNKIFSYKNINEAFKKLDSLNANIYFHNLDFDLLFFLENLEITKNIKDEPIIASGNRIISFKIDNVIFLNSLVLLPMPLKVIVSKFLKVIDSDYFNNKANVLDLDDDTLLDYCTKDVIYLHSAILKLYDFFYSKFDEKLKLTLPAMAYQIWYKHYLDNDEFMHISRRHEFFDDDYYFGGHTEKFIDDKMVFRNVYYYDINSLYPDRMQKLEFINEKLERDHPTINKLKSLVKDKELFFCEVLVNIDSENLRAFPCLKDKVNLYLFGEQYIKMSEVGINFILKWGSWDNILEVKTILNGYDGYKIKPFKKYVDYFYSMRKDDLGNDVIGKLLLNGLYGKFGQSLERSVKYFNVTETHDTEPVNIKFMDNGNSIETYIEESPPYMHYKNRLDICGKITESARLVMMDYINEIRVFGSVIYTDTDSIITYVNMAKNKELSCYVDDNKIGFLSDEIGYKDNVIILGQKMYCFYKSKKMAKKGIKVMELNDFKDIVRGKSKFFNKRFTKLHSLVDKGFFGIQVIPFTISQIRGRLDK